MNPYIDWTISNQTRQFIGNFGMEEIGKPLCIPLHAPDCSEPRFNCTCSEPLPAAGTTEDIVDTRR